jgi:hypothetical protein
MEMNKFLKPKAGYCCNKSTPTGKKIDRKFLGGFSLQKRKFLYN